MCTRQRPEEDQMGTVATFKGLSTANSPSKNCRERANRRGQRGSVERGLLEERGGFYKAPGLRKIDVDEKGRMNKETLKNGGG